MKLSGVSLLQGKVKQIIGSTLKDLDPSGCVSSSAVARVAASFET